MIAEIIAHAARAFDVPRADIIGNSRFKCHVLPRQAVAYALRRRGKLSTGDIGRHLGGRDHSTIIYACHRIEALIKSDPALRATVEAMIALRPDAPPYVAPERPKAKWKKPGKPRAGDEDEDDADIAEFVNRRATQAAASRKMLAALGMAA
jgi:hypothetical protein